MNLFLVPLLVSTLSPAAIAGPPAGLSAGPPAGPTADVNLLAALPSDAFAVLHVPNPRALMASRETNRWVAFATDAEWDSLLAGMLTALDLSSEDSEAAPEEVSAWRERVLGSFADSTGMVAFASGVLSENGPDPTIGLMVKGGEESSRLLRRFIGTDAKPTQLPNGAEVLLSDAGRAELYYEANGLILLLSTPNVEDSLAVAEECLNSMTAGDTQSAFDLPGVAARRPAAPTVEFVIDTRSFFDQLLKDASDLEPMQQRAIESMATIRWVYSAFELGTGEEADWNLYMPYGEDSLVGSALSFFGEADTSLLAHAPMSSLSATVGAFDLGGFSAWVLEEVKNASEELHGQAVAGLSGIQSAIGVDLMTDVLGNMTGQFLGFSSAPGPTQSGMVSMIGMTDPQTLVALVEDTDPLLDMVESLLNVTGMGDSVTSETRAIGSDGGEIEIYKTTEDLGLDVAIGVGEGRIMISADPETRPAYFDLVEGKESAKSVLDDPKRKKAVAAAAGAVVTIQPTVGFADLIDGMGEWFDLFVGGDFIPDQDPELNPNREEPVSMAVAAGRVADLVRQYFSGTMTAEARIGDGLVHLRTIAR